MKKSIFTLLCLTFLSGGLFAQTLDKELWSDVNASFRLFKKADLGLETGYRLDNNFSSSKIIYFEPDFSYEIIKNLEVGLSYRFSSKPNSTPTTENRIALALSYEIDLGKLDIDFRTKFQNDYIPNNANEPVWRNKVKFDYNLSKKVDPFIATEIFYDAGNGKEFEQFRIQTGVEFDLPKGMDFSVYYMMRNKFNVATPGNIHVVGLSYNFGKLNKKKKKKGNSEATDQ